MIIGKIAQAVLKLIMPNVIEHIFKVGKLDKLLNYMELPNEADKGVLKLQDQINILTGTVKDMTKDINTIQNNVKDLMKIIKNTKKLRSL